MDDTPVSIFLSHNWNDKPFTRKLAADLEIRGQAPLSLCLNCSVPYLNY
jgi:hypothetical protein